MKKEITRKEVLVLFKGLTAVTSLQGAKFAHAVVKNIDRLRPLAIEISREAQPPQKFWEYQDKYNDIIKKYSDKKKDVDKKVVEAEIIKLNKKYESVLKEADEKQKKVEKYLEEKVEVFLYMLPITCFPENIDGSKLEPIQAIIE
jgi:predicted Zn-dependent protease